MSIEVFFNRPDKPWPVERLLADIASAKECVMAASAWITDTEIIRAIGTSPAPLKYIATGLRGELTVEDDADERTCVVHGVSLFYVPDRRRRGGMLHHKFITVDRSAVWFGSFNFTRGARTNYEAIARVTDRDVIEQFIQEFSAIFCEEVTRREGPI